jgi:tetratricopeptide (TPR) repeat protein
VSELDYKGAIEAFEKALEVNPRSAAAHFELALLYEKKGTEPAAAIYHYEQYLRLRPAAENADILVKPHILACKQELARTVSLGAVTERQQHEFERLADENNRLKTELQAWRERYATNQPGPAPMPEPTPVRVAPPAQSSPRTLVSSPPSSPVSQPRILAASATGSISSRSHTVKAGETPTIIARRYGVKVDALMAANPRADSRHLKVGQVLTVPPL